MRLDSPMPKGNGATRPGTGFRVERGALQLVLISLIAVVVVIAALNHSKPIAVPTVLALLSAIALAPLTRQIERLRAPPSLAAALIVVGILFSSGAIIYALLPSAEQWNARAPQIIREIESRVRDISFSLTQAISTITDAGEDQTEGQGSPSRPVPQASEPVTTDADKGRDEDEDEDDGDDKEESSDPIDQLVGEGQKMAADWAISAPGVVAGAVYWAVLTFFLLRDRAMLGRKLMSLGAGLAAKRALARAMQDVQNDVSRYLLAITLINIALGVCVAGAFYLFGVANAPLWGVAAGVLNFMPFIGAVIMSFIALGVGLFTFESALAAFALVGVLVMLNSIEGQIVTPMVIGARIRLPAIGVFVAIVFGAWLWGAVGALVATPTLIVANAFVRRLGAARRSALQASGV